MSDLSPAINGKSMHSTWDNLLEHGRVYVSSPSQNESIHLNKNLIDILGFKRNIIEDKSVCTISGMECVIFADYPPGFSSDNYIFPYRFFVETSRVSNINVPLLHDFE